MTAIAGNLGAVYITSTPSLPLATTVCTNPSSDDVNWITSNPVARYLDSTYTPAPIVQTQCNEVEYVALTGNPTGGTFTLTFGAQTTAGILWNATASQVQTTLVALPSIGAGNVAVTGGPGPATPWMVEFTGTLGLTPQATMTYNGSLLTGGASPNVSVTNPQNGQAWTTLAAGYSVQWVGAVVVLASALLGVGASVRFFTGGGGYFPYSQLGDGHEWEITIDTAIADTTTFGSVWRTQLQTILSSTGKFSKFWNDATFMNLMTNLMVFSLFIDGSSAPTSGPRYEGYGYIKQDQDKVAVSATVDEDVSFEITGPLYYINN